MRLESVTLSGFRCFGPQPIIMAFAPDITAVVGPRILAISYKRDAATNLAARVRALPSQPRRPSRLADIRRLRQGLGRPFRPDASRRWRPRPDYEIMWTNDALFCGFLSHQVGAPPPQIGTVAEVQAISVKAFEWHHLVGSRLPVDGWPNPTVRQWAADEFWQGALHGGRTSRLSFPIIGRLAELQLRLNSMAREALRLTYSHLFMDEFQDTTQIQYDLVKTIFLGSNAVITAVGDNKQQIMRWAMATDGPSLRSVRRGLRRRVQLILAPEASLW